MIRAMIATYGNQENVIVVPAENLHDLARALGAFAEALNQSVKTDNAIVNDVLALDFPQLKGGR